MRNSTQGAPLPLVFEKKNVKTIDTESMTACSKTDGLNHEIHTYYTVLVKPNVTFSDL